MRTHLKASDTHVRTLVMDPMMSVAEASVMQREFALDVCLAEPAGVTHVREFLKNGVVERPLDVKATAMGYEFEFVPVQPLFYMPHCPTFLYSTFSTFFEVMVGNSLTDHLLHAQDGSRLEQQDRLQYDVFVDVGLQSTLLKDNEERSLVRRHGIFPKLSGGDDFLNYPIRSEALFASNKMPCEL